MRAHGIQGAKRRGKPWRTTTPDPAARRRPDLVERDFTAPRPGSAVGRRTSPTCAAGRAWCSSLRHRRLLAAGSSAGSSPRTCAPTSSSTRCGWRSHPRGPAPTSSSSHHTDRRQSIHQPRLHPGPRRPRRARARSARSATPTTTRMAESFVDSFKTELIADRVWRTRSQLELAIVEYVGWFNTTACTSPSATSPRRVRSTGHAPRTWPSTQQCRNQLEGTHQIRSPSNSGRLTGCAGFDGGWSAK